MSSRRSHLVLVGLIVLALVGTVMLALPGSPIHRGVKKGLDLQGGLEVVLKAQPPLGHKLTSADLDRAVSIMRNRVDKLGVSSPVAIESCIAAWDIFRRRAGTMNRSHAAPKSTIRIRNPLTSTFRVGAA